VNKQELLNFRDKVNSIKAEKKVLSSQLDTKVKELEAIKIFSTDSLEARAVIQSVAEKTQQHMIGYFENLITPLIQNIWQDDRRFCLRFVQKRGGTECEAFILKDGNEASIFGSSGGGLANIISIGCRLAFLVLERKTRKLMILDEPFSALNSSEYQQRISDTLKEISTRMGIQFLIVTDQIDIEGDRLFRVENGQVKVIN